MLFHDGSYSTNTTSSTVTFPNISKATNRKNILTVNFVTVNFNVKVLLTENTKIGINKKHLNETLIKDYYLEFSHNWVLLGCRNKKKIKKIINNEDVT